MYFKLAQFIKKHKGDALLLIVVVLISLFSFAIGFIVAVKKQEKEPIRIEKLQMQNFIKQRIVKVQDKFNCSSFACWNFVFVGFL